jgi:sugar phosphate isomerase/epimerase
MCQGCDTPSPEALQAMSRRGFLRTAAGAAAAAGLVGVGAAPVAAAPKKLSGPNHTIGRENISIQLFTLSTPLAADLEGTLEKLTRIGFQKVEHAGTQGKTAKQFRAILDRVGLKATSGHTSPPQPFNANTWQASLDDANTIGQTYIVMPAGGITGYNPATGEISFANNSAAWHALAADLNKAGAQAKKSGLKFGYHNHYWEFAPLTDTPQIGYDILLAETDPDLVHFEIDLYWAWYGHRDPVQLITTFQDRVRQFHVKDMKWVNGAGTFTDPGAGIIDFARIFDAVYKPYQHEFIIERDDAGANALNTAKVGFDFLRNIRF